MESEGGILSILFIECPVSEDGMERVACPTADRMGRYHCIDDHVLCDGFVDCPTGEDEDRQTCMFYKTVSRNAMISICFCVSTGRVGRSVSFPSIFEYPPAKSSVKGDLLRRRKQDTKRYFFPLNVPWTVRRRFYNVECSVNINKFSSSCVRSLNR